MAELSQSRRRVYFGPFEVDLDAGEIKKRGIRIGLQGQPFQILEMLLEHPGEIVTRDQVRARLWCGDTFGDFDHGINKAINKLREALNDSATDSRYVETVARRGYRFIAEVKANEDTPRPVETTPQSSAAVPAIVVPEADPDILNCDSETCPRSTHVARYCSTSYRLFSGSFVGRA
jgi:DNA-binding winged helix-turn-helix (wHTH) protein